MSPRLLLLVLTLIAAGPLWAEGPPSILVEPIPCLPVEANGLVQARVPNGVAGQTVRLYFRRLNIEVEDLYWLPMQPGNGVYWTVFPKPTDDKLTRKELERIERSAEYRWAQWWREKEISDDRDPNDDLDTELITERASVGKLEPRDWMAGLSEQALEAWLVDLEYEPVEYFGVVMDGHGREVARSALGITKVTRDCEADLNAQEQGLCENLTVGETAHWQQGEEPFHWLCDGIVIRVDPTGILRSDGVCRACVVAWWKTKSFLLPLASAGAVTGISILEDEPEIVSPSEP